jgi:hypothetical protein
MQRKRSRSREEYNEDFPLSKRINSLQISGEFTFIQNHITTINHNHISQHESHHVTSELPRPSYQPELSVDQNPYYYNKNRELYDLYVERVKRAGRELPYA